MNNDMELVKLRVKESTLEARLEALLKQQTGSNVDTTVSIQETEADLEHIRRLIAQRTNS